MAGKIDVVNFSFAMVKPHSLRSGSSPTDKLTQTRQLARYIPNAEEHR
jgi:hypothetical protein